MIGLSITIKIRARDATTRSNTSRAYDAKTIERWWCIGNAKAIKRRVFEYIDSARTAFVLAPLDRGGQRSLRPVG
jgi:hypothetical protein